MKLESENGEHERARILLANARKEANTKKVWMKSAVLERLLGNFAEARELLSQARAQYPDFDKLWMISGQIEEDAKDFEKAQELYHMGVRFCSFLFFLSFFLYFLEQSNHLSFSYTFPSLNLRMLLAQELPKFHSIVDPLRETRRKIRSCHKSSCRSRKSAVEKSQESPFVA